MNLPCAVPWLVIAGSGAGNGERSLRLVRLPDPTLHVFLAAVATGEEDSSLVGLLQVEAA